MPGPLTRTSQFACPPDCRSKLGPGCLIWRADHTDAPLAHRLELEAPPADLPAAFALWDQLQSDSPAQRRVLQWETGLEIPFPDLAPRFAPVRMLGMLYTSTRDSISVAGVPPELLEKVVQGAACCHPELGPSHVQMLRWLYQGLAQRGATTLACWEEDRVTASVMAMPSPDGQQVRLLELWTVKDRRRRGLASTLMVQALSLSSGRPTLLMTEEGSPAHVLYEKLGFAAVSRVMYVSTERPF
jgi:GNAT superfamily N-acetyltransferase